MTEQAILLAIAQSLPGHEAKAVNKDCLVWMRRTVDKTPYWYACPSFTRSLDAIVPVIRGLNAEVRLHVYLQLYATISLDPSLVLSDDAELANSQVDAAVAMATAAQWSEAYLRAMGEYAETS